MISENAKNLNRLLFWCAWKKCKFFEWWSYESDNGASNVTTEVASDKAEEFASQNKRHESVGLQGDGLMLLHQRLDAIERRLMGFRCTWMRFIAFGFVVVLSMFLSLTSN